MEESSLLTAPRRSTRIASFYEEYPEAGQPLRQFSSELLPRPSMGVPQYQFCSGEKQEEGEDPVTFSPTQYRRWLLGGQDEIFQKRSPSGSSYRHAQALYCIEQVARNQFLSIEPNYDNWVQYFHGVIGKETKPNARDEVLARPEPGSRSPRKLLKLKPFCQFCKNNERVRCEEAKIPFDEEAEAFWKNHICKDSSGKVMCPFLKVYVCPYCKASGENAHTLHYCPELQNEKFLTASDQ